jgi:hypothetical protein
MDAIQIGLIGLGTIGTGSPRHCWKTRLYWKIDSVFLLHLKG